MNNEPCSTPIYDAKKITELTTLTSASLRPQDIFPVVDVSAKETKSITVTELNKGLYPEHSCYSDCSGNACYALSAGSASYANLAAVAILAGCACNASHADYATCADYACCSQYSSYSCYTDGVAGGNVTTIIAGNGILISSTCAGGQGDVTICSIAGGGGGGTITALLAGPGITLSSPTAGVCAISSSASVEYNMCYKYQQAVCNTNGSHVFEALPDLTHNLPSAGRYVFSGNLYFKMQNSDSDPVITAQGSTGVTYSQFHFAGYNQLNSYYNVSKTVSNRNDALFTDASGACIIFANAGEITTVLSGIVQTSGPATISFCFASLSGAMPSAHNLCFCANSYVGFQKVS